jgi:hypothetical protein
MLQKLDSLEEKYNEITELMTKAREKASIPNTRATSNTVIT